MKSAHPDFSHVGFVKTFVLPALLVFLIPLLSLLFFWHAEETFDARAREGLGAQIQSAQDVAPKDRAEALANLHRFRLSRLIRDERVAANFDKQVVFDYATFRWMIRISVGSLAIGGLVFLLAGVCVVCSLRSHWAQYYSLLIGWQVLRLYSAVQTLAIAILLVALSYWVTALWFNVYVPKLIIIVGILALCGVAIMLAAIFKNPKREFVVEGMLHKKEPESPLWQALTNICTRVGAEPPDQIIAGIDDNFFVTENPVTLNCEKLRGKTLFVSLALLKQLNAKEAEAVLAHEMAHFSGQDTLYSKKIAPLLARYETYLQGLYEGGLTRPIFYFMVCFHALFALSLNKLSRQREFRADAVAGQATSPRDFAGALVRIAAYSQFRTNVEQDLFKEEQALVTADVSDRIARGFPGYAAAFATSPQLSTAETTHPFDSHPPMSQRLAALGIPFAPQELERFLSTPGDGGWYLHIPEASEHERRQWEEFEERFRKFHESTLPYRYLPATPEETAVVEKAFPPVSVESKDGSVTIDYEKIQHSAWPGPVHFSEVTQAALDDGNILQIHYAGKAKGLAQIKLKKFSEPKQRQILDAYQRYYGRHLAAKEYLAQKSKAAQGAIA
jgi:Zn-dependent protease with chaperone function